MKHIEYDTGSDMLVIHLSSAPATGGAENAGADGEDPDIIFSYDDQGKLVAIEIENASRRIDLKDIQANPENVVATTGTPVISYTVSELACKLDIAPRTLQQTLQTMADAGISVGRQRTPSSPIVLSEADVQAIMAWRETHRPGRPKVAEPAA